MIDIDPAKGEPTGGEKKWVTSTKENTRLLFETDTRTVRIFQGSERLHLNIYENSSKKTEQVGAIRLPDAVNVPEGADAPWQSYVVEEGGKVYVTRFVPLHQAEFVVSSAITGIFISRESVFRIEGTAYRNGIKISPSL